MTLTDLRYIVALAQERHFGRAAQQCHVSQPTLSVAVKKLEEQLGVMLFERGVTDVKLTEIGRQIIEQAQIVLREADQVLELATAGKDPFACPLRIGVIYTIAPYLLPSLIPAFTQLAPHTPLIIQESYTSELAVSLRKGKIDVAILALPFPEPGILTQPLYDEPFRVIMPNAHHWAKTDQAIATDQLQEEPLLLLGAGNCFRDQVLEACPRCAHGTGLQKTLEGSSLETIRHMVATGLGITVLPSSAADPLIGTQPLVSVRPFTEPEPTRRVALAWRVTFPRTKVIDTLRQAILNSAPAGVRPITSVTER